MQVYRLQKEIIRQSRKSLFWLFILVLYCPSISWAVYAVPSNRMITWKAGLDPVGGIPTYTSVTCTGLHNDGSVDDTSRINACISAAASGTAVYIPAGVYRVDGNINMKSNVVLRGAKAAVSPWLPSADNSATTLNMGSSVILFGSNGKDDSWNPTRPNGTAITSGYTKDSRSITIASNSVGYKTGDYISIYQDLDTSMMDQTGPNGGSWLGEDCNGSCSSKDYHVWQQYSKITGVSGSGPYTITFDPPINGTSTSPPAAYIRKQTMKITNAGVENIRIKGNGTSSLNIFIRFRRPQK